MYLPVESPEFPRAFVCRGLALSDCEFGQVHFCAYFTQGQVHLVRADIHPVLASGGGAFPRNQAQPSPPGAGRWGGGRRGAKAGAWHMEILFPGWRPVAPWEPQPVSSQSSLEIPGGRGPEVRWVGS
jgi:hypothetical protein